MPSIYLLLSSQEECGMGGAISISEYLISNLISNISCFITIDVCPKFGYGHGMALYTSNYDPYFLISSWVKNENPNVLISEGVTDYLVYANTFNKYGIPSIALEPAVANIHNIGEECWKSDIDITYNIVKKLVTNYDEEINQKRKKKGEA
jgi:putative aminopeptidase FrvX